MHMVSRPLLQRPRHEDRSVLIGHCWLYERSEFPPPPPPPPGCYASSGEICYGMAWPFLPALRPLLVPSFARTCKCAGLPGPTKFLGRFFMSCPCPSQSSGCSSISGWAAILYQLSRAGLGNLLCSGTCADARCAPLVLWVMSDIASLTTLAFVIFGRSMRGFLMMLIVPCVV